MKIEFDIFNREFFRTLTFSLKFQKESTSFYHIHEHYSVSSTFLYNGNSKCYVVRILYAISFQWLTCFWLSGTADRAITYIRSVELNGNREHEKK